jgi:predicted aspartyl protease
VKCPLLSGVDMEKYDTSEKPPAPYVEVEVTNPQTGESVKERGKIDTGSFKTVIPESWIDKLHLIPASEEETRGYKEEIKKQKHYTYFVNISIKNRVFEYAEVLAVKRDSPLIGRDILNQVKLILDGKNLSFEVLDP